MRQIRLHAPELWIILNGTKIGYSKSLWWLILKLMKLQSYVPFAILHFQAIQCRNGFDREQRCHFKFFQKRIAGEHYLLTVDDVRCIFKPLDDGSDGRVISGYLKMPKLLNRTEPDTSIGQVYRGSRLLPDDTIDQLRSRAPAFLEQITGLVKIGSVSLQTPSLRLGHCLWAFALSFQYAFVNSENPTVDEKAIQWEHAENGQHFAGENSLLDEVQREQLDKRMLSVSSDNIIFQGTKLRVGKKGALQD